MKCECKQDPCPTCRKIAAFRVQYAGKDFNVCTRCHLSGHRTIARLYDEPDIVRLVELDSEAEQNQWDTILDSLGGMKALLILGLQQYPKHGD